VLTVGATALPLALAAPAGALPQSPGPDRALAGRVCGQLRPGGTGVQGGAVRPAPVALPDGAVVRSVLLCQVQTRRVQSAEGRRVRMVVVREATRDLQPLLDELRRPDEPATQGPCAARLVLTPDVTLRLDDGTLLRPRFPLTACHSPQPDAVTAVTRLRTRTLAVVPQQRTCT